MRRTTGGSLLLTCLQKALEANPDYADAMFNLALLLQKLDRYGEGVVETVPQPRQHLFLGDPRVLKFCDILRAHLKTHALSLARSKEAIAT